MLLRASLICFVAAAFAAPSGSAQTTLAWKFKEGDVFFVEETNVSDQEFSIMGKTFQQKSTNRRVSRYEVKSAGPKGFILEQSIVSWRTTQEGGPPAPGPNDLLERVFKGVVFRVHLSRGGSLDKFEGYAELLARAGREFPGDEVKVFGAIVSEDLLKSIIEMAVVSLPANAAKIGERWNRRLRVPAGPLGIFLFKETMTYSGPARGFEQITVSTTFDYVPPKDTGGLPFRITKADLKSSGGKGTVLFDREKGRLVSYETTFPMSGNMTIEADGLTTSMDLRGTDHRTVRLLDRAPR